MLRDPPLRERVGASIGSFKIGLVIGLILYVDYNVLTPRLSKDINY